jgi:virginiamycin A acetyltransferase
MPSPDTLYPLAPITKDLIFLKNFITNPNISVGDYTYYHDLSGPENFEEKNVMIIHTCKLIIGKFCQITNGTMFIMSDANYPLDGFSTYPFFIFGGEWGGYEPKIRVKGDTIVGNDVWFGQKSVILPGVTIGDGAIIGAYAVVAKDVPPYSIAAGNPARIVKQRFENEVIDELLEIQWWNWDYDKIVRNIDAITKADVEKLKNAF